MDIFATGSFTRRKRQHIRYNSNRNIGMKYSYTYPITAAQIDGTYHLTAEGLLIFHENTIAKYLCTLGLAAFDLQKTDKTWVISEINMELPEPPTIWTENIRFTVWISELTPLRVWFDFTAMETHSGKTVAKGNSCWSHISMSQRHLVPCEGTVPAAEVVPELASGPHKRNKDRAKGTECVQELSHTVNRLDLDFNGHTTNRRYTALALLSHKEGYLNTHRPSSLHIRFTKESRLGDTLLCRTFSTDEPDLFAAHIMNGKGEEISRVTSRWVVREPQQDISEVDYIRYREPQNNL